MNESGQTNRLGLLGLIRRDVRAKAEWLYGDACRGNRVKACLTDGTFAMVVFRLMETCQRRGWTPLAMIFNKLNVVLGRCIIGRNVRFGPGFVLIHSMGVVINSDVRGGADVKLEHGVTIGAERHCSPVLGDNVFVGAGAKIIGGVNIGSNVKIGANAVVLQDVPSGATAVGVPARVIERPTGEGPGSAQDMATP